MGKLAFVFPGQGAQYQGMGKDISDHYPAAAAVFKEADQILGRNITDICFNGPEELLKDTRNAQPAILTTSMALLKVLQQEGIKPNYTAGHSLGEYSALVAAGAIDFATALKLVAKRSELMAAADVEGKGTMAAILGLDRANLLECLEQAIAFGRIEPANFNCPGQIVISGAKAGMSRVQELVAAKGGRFIPLAVSGPFHSSFMKDAAASFKGDLEKIDWKAPAVPVIANVTAQPVGRDQLQDSLYRQIYSSVLWEDSLNFLHNNEVSSFIEIGPGKVLSGLIKKTIKGAAIINCEDSGSIKKALAFLKEV